MKTEGYNSFWQRMHKESKNKGFPLRVMFELTYKCNFHCRHCYLPRGYKNSTRKELSTEEIFSILNQLAGIGCFYLGFTGGEPFLRKDIFKILTHAKRIGFQVIIYTNGSLIGKDSARELKRLNLNKVDITIPSLRKSSFERISVVRGSHNKVFQAIDFLHQGKVKLGFKSCLLQENEDEVQDIRRFAASLGAQHRLDDCLMPCLDGDTQPYRYRGRIERNAKAERSNDLSNHESHGCESILKRSKPNTQYSIPYTLFKCGAGLSQAAITPFGELKACVMLDNPKYKIRVQGAGYRAGGLENAWNKIKVSIASIKPDKNYQCNRCSLRDYCKWCPAKSWMNNKNFTTCDPQSRQKAGELMVKVADDSAAGLERTNER